MTSCLITGIAGHLGCSLARWLTTYYPEVKIFGIDNLSSGYAENVPETACWNTINLAEHPLRMITEIDYVFHFAAYPAECLSPFIREHNYRNNLGSTANVVNFCINQSVKRLVFTSTMAVYGQGPPPFDERDICVPIDPYGNAKLACERDIQIAGQQHGLDWCIIRPHNVYGEFQDMWTPYRNVLGIWMQKKLRDLPIRIYGDGDQRRAFSYIWDVIPSLWEAAVAPEAGSRIINLGCSVPISLNQLASVFQSVVGGCDIERAEARHEVAQSWCSVDLSRKLLKYPAVETPLKKGISTMWEWAKETWNRYPGRRNWSNRHPAIEVEKGLYSYWRSEK